LLKPKTKLKKRISHHHPNDRQESQNLKKMRNVYSMVRCGTTVPNVTMVAAGIRHTRQNNINAAQVKEINKKTRTKTKTHHN
jgi:precorrin isomerase